MTGSPHTADPDPPARGELRILLGAAAGVGTTFALLEEGRRRRERGADVRVAALDAHRRPATVAQAAALDVDPLRTMAALDDLLGERPDVVLVDDLAIVEDDGVARRTHVDRLLDAGVDVVGTLRVAEIASLGDLAAEITGRQPIGTVPDDWLHRADQIELVDITPEAMRRRIAHGNAFAVDELDAETAELFDGTGFAALRALMMSWMADRLADVPTEPSGVREQVLVAVTAAPGGDVLVRRAARLAQRARGQLLGIHVRTRGHGTDESVLAARRTLLADLGGSYHEVEADDVTDALHTFAAASGATQLVLGTSGRSQVRERFGATTVAARILGRPHRFDVHFVAPSASALGPRATHGHWQSPLSPQRRWIAAVVGALSLTMLTVLLSAMRDGIGLSTALILYLLAVVVVAAIGGRLPGLVAAVVAPLLANWFLVPPLHTLQVADGEHVVSLLAFVTVALVVSTFVSIAARRTVEAHRARDEATTLAGLAATTGTEPLAAITDHLRESFDLDGVALVREGPGGHTSVVATSGLAPSTVADAMLHEPIADGIVLLASGRPLSPDDHRVVRAYVQQLARALDQQRLAAAAARAEALDRTDELRTALLRAVSHDLRTPLAGIKASVSSLRQTDVQWPDELRDEFLETIEDETDRLASIVTNLLDLGRLQAGALRPSLRAASTEEVVAAALASLGRRAEGVGVELPLDLPEVVVDPAMLERVVANLVGNALGFSPEGRPPRVSARHRGDTVQLQVVDHGPGIHPRDRATVLRPFHRLDDATSHGSLGLGLAIADGLTRAMGGDLTLRDTAGGGLTAVVTLPTGSAATP